MMRLNPNEKIVEAIQKRLVVTGGFCPCIPETEWNEDTICLCKKMREEEVCCCGLYVRDEMVDEKLVDLYCELKKAKNQFSKDNTEKSALEIIRIQNHIDELIAKV